MTGRRAAEQTVHRVDQLRRDLEEYGAATATAANGDLLISAYREQELSPSMRLSSTHGELAQHLHGLVASGQDLWPDASADQGAYNLFLLHLEEALATDARPGADLILDGSGVRVEPTPRRPDLDLQEEAYWSPEPPAARPQ